MAENCAHTGNNAKPIHILWRLVDVYGLIYLDYRVHHESPMVVSVTAIERRVG